MNQPCDIFYILYQRLNNCKKLISYFFYNKDFHYSSFKDLNCFCFEAKILSQLFNRFINIKKCETIDSFKNLMISDKKRQQQYPLYCLSISRLQYLTIPNMNPQTIKRLQKDFKEMEKNSDSGMMAYPDESNLLLWQGMIMGPEKTIWEGGMFNLQLTFPQDYPNKPPKVVFKSEMFHPNIYKDGRICLDILDKQWSSIYDVIAILTSIRSLLNDPNTQSPANPQASQIFSDNKQEYQRRVKQIVSKSLD